MTGKPSLDSLPFELVRQMCSYLNYPSLCNLVLVSRVMSVARQDPTLWRAFVLRPRNNFLVETILNTKRFSQLQSLCITVLNRANLSVIRQKPNIRCLEIDKVDDGLDKDHFAEGMLGLEAVALTGGDDNESRRTSCRVELMATLLIKMSNERSRNKIKRLTLAEYDLSSLDPNIFGNCFSQLDSLSLDYCHPTPAQMSALFTRCTTKTNLKKLQLNYVELEAVDPDIFSQGIRNIHQVTFCSRWPSDNQIEKMFESLSEKTNLKELDLNGKDLSCVDPDILAHGVNKLERLDISFTQLTKHQLERIFQQAVVKTSLRYLDITGNINRFGLDIKQEVQDVLKKTVAVKW